MCVVRVGKSVIGGWIAGAIISTYIHLLFGQLLYPVLCASLMCVCVCVCVCVYVCVCVCVCVSVCVCV